MLVKDLPITVIALCLSSHLFILWTINNPKEFSLMTEEFDKKVLWKIKYKNKNRNQML